MVFVLCPSKLECRARLANYEGRGLAGDACGFIRKPRNAIPRLIFSVHFWVNVLNQYRFEVN